MNAGLTGWLAAARHAAATAWCQDDTTMPEVDAFGAGWDAAVAEVAARIDRDEIIAALSRLPLSEWDGDREEKRLRIVYGAAADRVLTLMARWTS